MEKQQPKPQLKDFLKGNFKYDEMGQFIWLVQPNGNHQKIADLRAWGAIQNLFKDKKGAVDENAAAKFQDELGEFIVKHLNSPSQPLLPTPELQQMLDEKYPIMTEQKWVTYPDSAIQSYEDYLQEVMDFRLQCTEFYLAGQSSLKQGTPTDEDIKNAAADYAKEYCDLGNENEVNGAKFDFMKGMQHYRDTYASKQEIDWETVFNKEFPDQNESNQLRWEGIKWYFDEFLKPQLSEEKK